MKTPIKRLDSLTHNDTAATKTINDNFAALQQGIEDSLSRTGKTPNFMDAELDMNTRRIINVGEPVNDGDVVNKRYIDEYIRSIDDLETALAQEVEDRQLADRELATGVSTERDRAELAEGRLSSDITAERDRATLAEGALSDRIDAIKAATFRVWSD